MIKVSIEKVLKQHTSARIHDGSHMCNYCGAYWPCAAIELARETEQIMKGLENLASKDWWDNPAIHHTAYCGLDSCLCEQEFAIVTAQNILHGIA